jgi:hypothetical protein
VAAVVGPAPLPHPVAAVLAASVGCLLALLVSRLDDLVALYTPSTLAAPRHR